MATHRMKFRAVENGMVVFECENCHRPVGLHPPESGRADAAIAAQDDTYKLPLHGADLDSFVTNTLGGKCDG